MGSAWLADAVLLVHILFVLFIVGGFALILAGAGRWGWVRNRAFRIAHLAAIVFVAVETLLGFTCPLTLWEDVLRTTGRGEHSFIGRWLAWLLYYNLPECVFAIADCAFALAVVCARRALPLRARAPRRPRAP